MKAVVQRVAHARVDIAGVCVAEIQRGLMVLVGVAPADGPPEQARLLRKILHCRLFPDEDGRMSRSIVDVAGGLLLVPNFTLMADVSKGARPSFTPAAAPELARALFSGLCEQARQQHAPVAFGVFGADMQVSLQNDGPVTILLEV
jgi:D-tyrosyl-tRNA(Tyr) deacylase